jgi:N-acetylglucosamine malate deacetylase 1
MKIDIIAIGAHPDDIEIGMGGSAAKAAESGKKVQFVHLTKAELSSNGTVEEREEESKKACSRLGVLEPVALNYPDRGLLNKREEIIAELVQLIRTGRPDYLFAPYFEDRHPDHAHCSSLVKEAFFSSGIKKYGFKEAWRPKNLYYYQINGLGNPDFAIDITETAEKKFEALQCFKSQFEKIPEAASTPLNSGYLEDLRARDRLTGRESGVDYAEGFKTDALLLHNPFEEEEEQ